jgi:integrase
MPYARVPAFMQDLAARGGIASIALRFLILTDARTSEVLGCRWVEISDAATTWTVPAERIKAGKEHRVALSEPALELLRTLPHLCEYVFPGLKQGMPLKATALSDVLKRMKVADATVHGFRSSFRDWTAEQTSAPHDVVEACLAHATGNAVVRAYLRSDFFEKRRQLMEHWGQHCLAAGAEASNLVHLDERGP